MKHSLLWISAITLLGSGIWFASQQENTRSDAEDQPPSAAAAAPAKDAAEAVFEANISTLPPAPSLESLRQHLISHPGRWGLAERAQVLAIDPAQFFELLDDDELLVRDEARDLVREIYGNCGISLAVAEVLSTDENQTLPPSIPLPDAPGNGWCRRLAAAAPGAEAWQHMKDLLYMKDLLSLSDHAALGQDWPGQRAEQRAAEAALRADGSLKDLLLTGDAIYVTAALEAMQAINDTSAISDWSLMGNLAPAQQDLVWLTLRHGLDCQWSGNCSENSFHVAALCNMPNTQCDAGASYYTIIRRSLSPAQFDALMMLMNGVNAYRRQHRG